MISFILALLPSFIHVPLRRIMGAKIGKGSKIKWGTIIRIKNKNLEIGNNTKIGPLLYISASKFSMGNNGTIKPFSIISTSIVDFREYVHIAPLIIIHSDRTADAKITLDDHVRVFPYSWIEPGHGVYIGKQASVGTYNLIYTHGVWANYLKGGPVTFGPVRVEEGVWLPPRVFILPNVTIGEYSIIAGSSVVSRSIPAHSMAAGAPARVIKEGIMQEPDAAEMEFRIKNIMSSYKEYTEYRSDDRLTINENGLSAQGYNIIIDNPAQAKPGDLVFIVRREFSDEEINSLVKKGIKIIYHPTLTFYHNGSPSGADKFFPFLRRFGIRLYEKIVK